jgi:trk system potassium uptake protein
MNVLVVGGSLMALRTAEALMAEHQVVSLRDSNQAIRFDRLDVETIVGSATSPDALRQARVTSTDVFVACSDSDEQNIVGCLAAKRMGAKRTICVLSSHGFLSADGAQQDLADSLGIDEVIKPGEQLAQEIVRIVCVPGALDARTFADGRVLLLRYAVEAGAPITEAAIRSVSLPRGVVLVTIRRGDELILPRGETRVMAGDKVVAMGRSGDLAALARLLRRNQRKEKRSVAIVGAGSVGVAIARSLLQVGWQVAMIENDRARCERVSEELDCLVLHGDGADLDLLEQERIGEMSVVVCVTNNDEKNLLVSLLVKGLGVQRIVTRADRSHNERMFERVGVDVVLSARGAAVRSVVQSIDTSHREIRAVLEHGSACVIELQLPADFPAVPLSRVRPPHYAVVGAIVRGKQVLVPGGADELRSGDNILVFCSAATEDETREFFLDGPAVRNSLLGNA